MTPPGVVSPASLLGSSIAAELTEGQAAVRVFLAAGGLVLLGVGLACMTVWWWRSTRPEPPALGPLEVMSDRRWRTAGESERRRMVEEMRPEGAGGRDLVVAPVPIDLSELVRDVPSFDDLRDVSLESDRPSLPDAATADPEALELASSSAVASAADGEPASVEPEPIEPGSVEPDVIAPGSVESGSDESWEAVDDAEPASVPSGGEIAASSGDHGAAQVGAGVDETVAMLHPGAADPAVQGIDGDGNGGAETGVSPEGEAGTGAHEPDGSTDATIAQPRPIDLGHPVGRD